MLLSRPTSRAAQAALAVLASLSLLLPVASAQGAPATCNGHAELCGRLYSNVSFVGAHNSYAVGVNNLATNQDQDVTQQLNDGIRLLQMQAFPQNGQIRLCHTSCILYDGGTLADYLGKVKTWMDSNPNEVVTLLIVNSDSLPPSQLAPAFVTAGLDTMAFTPPQATLALSAWPTMGDLISSGKRLVVFLNFEADFSSVPYIIDEFTNMWETAFDVLVPTFDCEVNRTKGDATTQMYLINHFLDEQVSVIGNSIAPNKGALNQTNAVSGPGSLGQQASDCGAQYGRSPNFLLVDFYNYGNGSVFEVAASLNGVPYDPTKPVAAPIPDTGGNSTTTSTPNGGVPAWRGVGLLGLSVPLLMGAGALGGL